MDFPSKGRLPVETNREDDTSDSDYNYSVSDETNSEDDLPEELQTKKEKLPFKEYRLTQLEFPDNMITGEGKTRSLWDSFIIVLSIY